MDNKEIVLRISKIRQRANFSARALSLEIGMNASYINMLESKGFEPSITVLMKILEACKCTPEEFFYSNIDNYESDKSCLQFFQTLSEKQKNAIKNLYN